MKLFMIEIDDGHEGDPIVMQIKAEDPQAAYDRIQEMSHTTVHVAIAATIDMDQVSAVNDAAWNEATGGKIH